MGLTVYPFHAHVRNGSARMCIGKGREGIRKGRGMDLSQYQSLPTYLGARAARDWDW